MLSHNISTQPDNWNDYFTQQVSEYQSIPLGFGARPEVGLIDKSENIKNEYDNQEQVEAYPTDSNVYNSSEIICQSNTIKPINHIGCCIDHHKHKPIHPHKPCSLQHKPIGMVTHIYPYGRFVDDDKPDWHKFKNPNRKPRLYIEVIDKDNPCGPVHLKPLEPVINPKDEVEDVVDLDNPMLDVPEILKQDDVNVEVEEEIFL